MYWIEKILGIIWPIIQEIFKAFSLEEYLKIIGIYILTFIVLRLLVDGLKPTKIIGNFFSEVLDIFLEISVFLIPLATIIKVIEKDFPMLTQLVSFLLDKSGFADTLLFWFKILILICVVYAFQKVVIHFLSITLQRFFRDLPFSQVVLPSIRVAEGILFMMTTIMLPFWFLYFANQLEEKPVVLSSALGKPEGVIDEVWGYIEEGRARAQENGVSCDPYLGYSLKEYETGNNICTEKDANLARPNQCASYAGALGMCQFLPETYARNAARHGVTESLWNPSAAFEVMCYFVADEVNISLDQTKEEFVNEFSTKGFIWNADPAGAAKVYDRAIELRASAGKVIEEEIENPPTEYPSVNGYLWPGPEGSYLWYQWGIPMWYGHIHNGIDIAMNGLPAFKAVALADGEASYRDGGDCNAGIITLRTNSGEVFLYVHMTWDTSRIFIPTNGEWVNVQQGQPLGWIHNGNTTCSIGSHLHLMRSSGAYIGQEEFKR